jgi:hypothetical protein
MNKKKKKPRGRTPREKKTIEVIEPIVETSPIEPVETEVADEPQPKEKEKRHLRLRPRHYFRVNGPCEVQILMVANKWVHMLVTHDKEHIAKWGSSRRMVTSDGVRDEYVEAPEDRQDTRKKE